jgi:hypothetical protein
MSQAASMNGNLTTFITVIVGMVWAIVGIVSLFTGDVTELAAITPVMLIVTGFWMATKKNGGNK